MCQCPMVYDIEDYGDYLRSRKNGLDYKAIGRKRN